MSEEPTWLTRPEVERIHLNAIEVAGGAHGLRDTNLLEPAIARPRNLHAYGEDGLFQLAASYAESIARNHSFNTSCTFSTKVLERACTVIFGV